MRTNMDTQTQHQDLDRSRRVAGRLVAILLCLFGFLFSASTVRAEISKEYQVKAAFLYNFTKFVEWPSTSFSDPTEPIVIGVLGENPFGDELENVVRGRKVNGRPLVVREFDSVADLKGVHLVFISAAADKRMGAHTHALEREGMLTVGEDVNGHDGNEMILFTLVDNKVRFEIDQGLSDRLGLKISAQLLKLATNVRRKG